MPSLRERTIDASSSAVLGGRRSAVLASAPPGLEADADVDGTALAEQVWDLSLDPQENQLKETE